MLDGARLTRKTAALHGADHVILASTISHVERLVDDETQRGTCEIDGLITAIDSDLAGAGLHPDAGDCVLPATSRIGRSEEHTSELQSLMRTSYAVFCLKKKKIT